MSAIIKGKPLVFHKHYKSRAKFLAVFFYNEELGQPLFYFT